MNQQYIKAKQFVVFKLDNQYYGVDIQMVQIIERMKSIMRVPKAPLCVRGVMNLRGEIIPVIDIRIQFGIESKVDDEDTRIIILKTDESMVGIIVDQVKEVLELSDSQIEPMQSMPNISNSNYIQAVGKLDDEDLIVTLLNLNYIIEEAFKIEE